MCGWRQDCTFVTPKYCGVLGHLFRFFNQSGHRSRWPQRRGMLHCDRAPEMAVQVGGIYERIHYDPRPIDVVILGASASQVGLSAAAIEKQLAEHGLG
jgi:hypothetical protein